ncbi:MAG: hypothetical protein M0Z85_12460, partial [Gammaproteobacteria bacterium]|nr:hypothetical protein [Gammaproteobacteria bacterium]
LCQPNGILFQPHIHPHRTAGASNTRQRLGPSLEGHLARLSPDADMMAYRCGAHGMLPYGAVTRLR